MSGSSKSPKEAPLVLLLNRVVDFGLGGVLFIAPLAMAGRYEPGRLLLAVIVGITGIAWFLSRLLSQRSQQHWFWSGAEWIGLLAVVLVALQVAPWSPGMLKQLSPEVDQLLPLLTQAEPADPSIVDPSLADANVADADTFSPSTSNESTFAISSDANANVANTSDVAAETIATESSGGVAASMAKPFSVWKTASLTPHLTMGGLAMVCVFVMFFFIVLQRCRKRADIERMMKGMALSGVFMAALGIVQYFINNGRFLWFMSHPSRDTLTSLKATFANENHFAHFLALTIGPLLWWLVKVHAEYKNNEDEPKQPVFGAKAGYSVPMSQMQVLLCIAIGLVFVAGLMTYSKGGLIVLTIAAMISVGLFVLQKRVGRAAVIIVCTAAAIASLAVFFMGKDILVREMESLQTVSADSWDPNQGRRKIWTAVLSAVPDFAILGSGVGSHRYVYPTYFSAESSVQYTHAESGFLNLLLETGGPGLGLLLVGIGLTFYWLFKAITAEDEDIKFLAVPLVASLTISLIHAVFDFNWYIPANLCVTLIMVALCARLWDLAENNGQGRHRYRVNKATWGVLTIAALMVSAFSIGHHIGPSQALPSWHEFRAWSLAARRGGPGRRRELGKVDAMDPETINHMIELLDETIKYNPNHGRAHVRLASMCMRQFELLQANSENSMSLAQIRDAALTAGFQSHEEMTAWVDRVVGENRVYLDRILKHSKEGIRLTPTEGNAYLYLAEVAFLDKTIAESEFALMEQAYAVRPYDAAVQFSFGRHQLMAGDRTAAETLWKDAFQRGNSVRKRIIAAVGFQATPQQIIDLFQPGLEGLRDLFEYYRRRGFTEQMNYVGPKLVVELEKQAKIMSGETASKLWFDAQFVHATLGKAEEAAAAAKNAVMVSPTNFDYHYACGLRMRDCKRFEEAAKEFRWCASRRPSDLKLSKIVSEMKRKARLVQAETADLIQNSRFEVQRRRR